MIGAYEAQCESIEKIGGRIVLLASRALAACARSPDDYRWVYGKVLAQLRAPAVLHWPGALFDPALASYWGHTSLDDALGTCLDVTTDNAARIDGVALALLDPARELALRRHLPAASASIPATRPSSPTSWPATTIRTRTPCSASST